MKVIITSDRPEGSKRSESLLDGCSYSMGYLVSVNVSRSHLQDKHSLVAHSLTLNTKILTNLVRQVLDSAYLPYASSLGVFSEQGSLLERTVGMFLEEMAGWRKPTNAETGSSSIHIVDLGGFVERLWSNR